MNEEDRRYLTEWGGGCWMDELDRERAYECGKKHTNRTFDTWEDFGWLWENFCRKYYGRFIWWICGKRNIAWIDWEYKSPAERCQLICDFLREQEAGE